MHLLVGFLTGSDATCRLQAVRCLHELSHSPHASVSSACLPATPYLLTYLSGQSTKFTVSSLSYQVRYLVVMQGILPSHVCMFMCTQELCLYTLGNLCPDSDAVKEKLLAQGIIPALANCLEVNSLFKIIVIPPLSPLCIVMCFVIMSVNLYQIIIDAPTI